MASEELRTIIGALQAMQTDTEPSIEELRTGYEAMGQMSPPPDGVTYEPADAGGVPAEWAIPTGVPEGTAVVYLHGGGYVIGNLNTHRSLVGRIAQASARRVLAVDYRLAPEHPHPAALDDALVAYRWLLSQGYEASKLAIAGDSAGGGLTLATLLALRDAGDPLPAAAVPISPWTDLEMTGSTIETVDDPLITDASFLKRMADLYLDGQDAKQPAVSPLNGDLSGLPPMLIHVGTQERLLDDSRRLAKRAKAAGVDATLEEWDEMIHVWHAFAPMLPEANEAIDKVGAFVRAKLG